MIERSSHKPECPSADTAGPGPRRIVSRDQTPNVRIAFPLRSPRLLPQRPDAAAHASPSAAADPDGRGRPGRSEEHTSELQSLMRSSYAVFCLKKKKSARQPKE